MNLLWVSDWYFCLVGNALIASRSMSCAILNHVVFVLFIAYHDDYFLFSTFPLLFILQVFFFLYYIYLCSLFGQVGTSATNVGRTPTFCVTHVHFHCARDAVKMQLYFVLEEAKVFVSPAWKLSWWLKVVNRTQRYILISFLFSSLGICSNFFIVGNSWQCTAYSLLSFPCLRSSSQLSSLIWEVKQQFKRTFSSVFIRRSSWNCS